MPKRALVETLGGAAIVAILATLPNCALRHPARPTIAGSRYRFSMTLIRRGPDGVIQQRRLVDSGQESFRWTDANRCDDTAESLDRLRAIWRGRVQQPLDRINANTPGTTESERMQFAGAPWCAVDVAERREASLTSCTAPADMPAMPVESCPEMPTGAVFVTEPAEVTFMDARIDTVSTRPLVVRNLGTAPLTFRPPAIEWMAPAFGATGGTDPSCTGTSIVLPPMGWCNLMLTFQPMAEGSVSAALRFETDEGPLVHRVPLSGRGTR